MTFGTLGTDVYVGGVSKYSIFDSDYIASVLATLRTDRTSFDAQAETGFCDDAEGDRMSNNGGRGKGRDVFLVGTCTGGQPFCNADDKDLVAGAVRKNYSLVLSLFLSDLTFSLRFTLPFFSLLA